MGSLWLPPRGAQTFLLAAGSDRSVRHWSLDPERHAAEAYIVTPSDPPNYAEKGRERTIYSSNQLGDVLVVQEHTSSGAASATRPGSKSQSAGSVLGLDTEEPRGLRATNPNHRDAILDLC